MITELTADQEKSIYDIRDEYIAKGRSTKQLSDQKITDIVSEFYKQNGMDGLKSVFIMDSPLGCQILANFLRKNTLENIGKNIKENIGENVWENIGRNIRENIGENIGRNIRK